MLRRRHTFYLAGPMRGYHRYNFDAFAEARTYLRQLGHWVICPAERDIDKGFDPGRSLEEQGFDLAEAMREDFRLILDVDSIILLPGWQDSTGAKAEKMVAELSGKPVYYYAPDGHDFRIHPTDLLPNGDPMRVADAAAPAVEVRTKNALTGGEKGSKLARYDLIPAGPLRILAEHFGRGAEKYEDRNWEQGYDWSLSFAALQRHAWAFWAGEDIDPETGSPHLAAVAWHAFAMMEWAETHPDLDNRPRPR